MKRKKVNYLSNKDLLVEIHKSKMSYSSAIDEKYSFFDAVIPLDQPPIITDAVVQEAKENKAKRLSMKNYDEAINQWMEQDGKYADKPKQADNAVSPNDIPLESLVIRIMTFDHVPEQKRKKNPKTIADNHIRCNFPPFKQYAYIEGEWREVVRSHWIGGFNNGHFSLDHGQVTRKYSLMLMKMVDNYAMKGNWRGYSYIDEMKGAALVQLSQVSLYYDESKGSNPFSYITSCLSNSFTGVLNNEKKMQNIRDAVLEANGQLPSYNRQIEDELAQQNARREHEESLIKEQNDAGYNI